MTRRKTPLAALDKSALIASVMRTLEARHAALAQAAEDTRKGAIHPENRAEGSKDMRATEQSYIARGQAMRVEALDAELEALRRFEPRAFGADDPIAVGALVHVVGDDFERTCLLLVGGAGVEVAAGSLTVTVVTGESPLGRALVGRVEGDDLELVVAGRRRELTVDAVA